MKNFWQTLRGSLTTRLLLLFSIASLLIIALLLVTLAHGFRSQWHFAIRPHLEQYLDLVNAEIGVPPDLERAREMADRLPINIYVLGPDLDYSTTGKPLDMEHLEFHRGPPRRHHRRRSDRHKVEFGELDDRSVLRSRLGEYTVYYEVSHRRRGPGRSIATGVALFALLSILLGCYLILRRMLRPVRDIQHGAVRMGAGELDYRVPVRADNDLGALARSINNMASDIEQMLDAKRQLLLGASHELRTPITRAKVALQMLPASANRERIADDLEEMSSLISEILESERIKGGHAVLDRTEVDLPALLDSLLEDMHHPAIDVTADPSLTTRQLDETRIRLLLRNLIGNALTHGAAPTGDSTAANPTVTLQADDKGAALVIVRDHGPGIDAQHLQHLTEPFYRADPSRTRSTGGFGLGLHLCLLIARAHGGDLSIDSQPGDGTTVTVALPIEAH